METLTSRARVRAFLAKRDGPGCFYRLDGCEGDIPLEQMHIDHRIPYVLCSGEPWAYSTENLRLACPSCNMAKQDKAVPKADIVPPGPHVMTDYEDREKRKAWMARMKASGKCVECGEPRKAGNASHCEKHAAQHGKYNQTHKDRLVSEGRCQTCGKPRGVDGTSRLCRPCAHEQVDRVSSYQKTAHGREVVASYTYRKSEQAFQELRALVSGGFDPEADTWD